jgi:micrococcal nuclease
MNKDWILLWLALSFGPMLISASTYSYSGRVVGIKDGDTYVVLSGVQQHIVRLAHVDCPEKKQPYGQQAKLIASRYCFGKTVIVKSDGKKDKYKREIAEIYLGAICINQLLVKLGYAWHFIKYSNDKTYAALELTARKSKIGLWASPNPVAPWEWRAAARKNKRKR